MGRRGTMRAAALARPSVSLMPVGCQSLGDGGATERGALREEEPRLDWSLGGPWAGNERAKCGRSPATAAGLSERGARGAVGAVEL